MGKDELLDADFTHPLDAIRAQRQVARGWAIVGLAVAAWLLVCLTSIGVVLVMRMA